MKAVDVHITTCNEQDILPYTLRHYKTYASRIFVHDNFSKDRTREIAVENGATVLDWPAGAEVDEWPLINNKNACWRGTDADFVAIVDADELLYFPLGAEATLEVYAAARFPVIKPYGYEMTSEAYPTTAGQIYGEVKFGARDDRWYAKPILFAPQLITDTGIGVGSHSARTVCRDGRIIEVNEQYPMTIPPCYLLHFHQIGPLERIAKVYDDKRARMCENNRRNRWGNHDDGMKHATDKRNYIKARLERVIP